MISVNGFNEKEKIEVSRMKRDGKNSKWVDDCPPNTTYLGDKPSVLPGFAEAV